MSTIRQILKGTFIHSLSLCELEVVPCGFLGITNAGKIAFFARNDREWMEATEKFKCKDVNVEAVGKGKFILPGLVDCHTHAPQYAFMGTGMDLPLLEWLNTYTFPVEAKFADTSFAQEVYSKCTRRHIRSGTTTCCYFATIHNDASYLLVDAVRNVGQRALVGKVNMDRNSPDYYIEEDAGTSLEKTKEFIKYVEEGNKQSNSDLVIAAITPRFVPTCTSDLMKGLGDLAAEHSLPIQSHLSENKNEITWVKELHPECTSYTDVYNKYNLLNGKTVMAHCVHLSDQEMALMKDKGAGVAHCPNSNFSLTSGVCPLRTLINFGVKVGLGTDVAGGSSISMLDAIRTAVTASKVKAIQDPEMKPLAVSEAFYLATMGGAKVLSLEDKIGNFEPNKEFDALIVDPCSTHSSFDVFSCDTTLDIFNKFVFSGDHHNIESVYVGGCKVV